MPKSAADILNDLISTCRDSQEGYSKAAKGVHNDELRDFLMEVLEERGAFIEELQDLVEEPADRPHGGGILHPGWSDLEDTTRPKSDAEIVRNCIDGDVTTLDHYSHAISSGALEEDLLEIVEEQMESVRATLEELRARQNSLQHA